MLEPALVPWDPEGRKMGFLPSRSLGSSWRQEVNSKNIGVDPWNGGAPSHRAPGRTIHHCLTVEMVIRNGS